MYSKTLDAANTVNQWKTALESKVESAINESEGKPAVKKTDPIYDKGKIMYLLIFMSSIKYLICSILLHRFQRR